MHTSQRGWARPTTGTNAWVPSLDDKQPQIHLKWDQPQSIHEITLMFDTDFDHAMETVLLGHPENVIPFCVQHYRVLDADGSVVAERSDNHQTIDRHVFDTPIVTEGLTIELIGSNGNPPAALFAVRCYTNPTH